MRCYAPKMFTSLFVHHFYTGIKIHQSMPWEGWSSFMRTLYISRISLIKLRTVKQTTFRPISIEQAKYLTLPPVSEMGSVKNLLLHWLACEIVQKAECTMVGVSEKCQGKIHADRLSLRGKTGTILDLFHGMQGTCFLVNFGLNCDGKPRNTEPKMCKSVLLSCVLHLN